MLLTFLPEDENGDNELDESDEKTSDENDLDDEDDESDLMDGIVCSKERLSRKNVRETEIKPANEDEQAECPICLIEFTDQIIGQPGSCKHLFCFECVKEWSKVLEMFFPFI